MRCHSAYSLMTTSFRYMAKVNPACSRRCWLQADRSPSPMSKRGDELECVACVKHPVEDFQMKLKSALPSAFLVMFAAAQLFVSVTPAEDAPKRIEVTARQFQFTPAEITLKKGEPVVLVLNSMDTTHGLEVEELGLTTEIHKGKATELAFTPDKAGTFVGHCAVFCGAGHGGMTLTLHIEE